MRLASCVRPPVISCMRLRDKDAEKGAHEKNAPNIFDVPCTVAFSHY